MCPTGTQLEAAWRATCIQITPGQEFNGLEAIQETLKRERARVEYQTALEQYRQHLRSCAVCKPVNLRDVN
jgi:hypothetical protein